jgi:transcriptional regulator with XRE-family HTH domain
VKSGAKADRAALRQRLLDAGQTLDDIAAEMRRRWRFRPRESYRHAHGWSQDEVAARFTEMAARLAPGTRAAPMVGTRIGEYERWPVGGRRPSPYVLTVLAEVYGTELARLLDDSDTAAMPEQDRAVLAALTSSRSDRPLPRRVPRPVPQPLPAALPPGVPAALPVPIRAAEPTPPRPASPRPAPPPPVATVPTGPPPWSGVDEPRASPSWSGEAEFMARAAAEAVEFGERAEASSVGPITLEQLEQDVRAIARDYLTQPPFPLLRRTLHRRRRVFTLLEGRLRPAHARDLYLLAGRLCGLAAWMIGDLGYSAAAGAHARIAWLCADIADHDPLRGWVRATQSKLAYWDGRAHVSAQLAEDGLRHGVRDSGRVLLAGLAARGWARDGDAGRARGALARLTAEREALAAGDEVGGVWGFSEAQQHYLAGTTHLWLREPEEAARAADRAVWLYEIADPGERFYGAESLALLDSAIAHVLTGAVADAVDRLAPVLALPPEKRVTLITSRATDLRRVLDRTTAARGTAAALANDLADFERTAS